jgi:hypothetical protein
MGCRTLLTRMMLDSYGTYDTPDPNGLVVGRRRTRALFTAAESAPDRVSPTRSSATSSHRVAVRGVQ